MNMFEYECMIVLAAMSCVENKSIKNCVNFQGLENVFHSEMNHFIVDQL